MTLEEAIKTAIGSISKSLTWNDGVRVREAVLDLLVKIV